jgi:hypothetical protein
MMTLRADRSGGGVQLIDQLDGLRVSAFRLSAAWGDWAFALSQPLRLESGEAVITAATGYDLAARRVVMSERRAGLAPDGRELALELGYRRALPVGLLQINGFARRDPGHDGTAPADLGVLLRIDTRF